MKPGHPKRLGKASFRITEAYNQGRFPEGYPEGRSALVQVFMAEFNQSGDWELAVQAVERLAQAAPIVAGTKFKRKSPPKPQSE